MDVTVLGIDLAKTVFQLHGINEEGQPVLERRLSRKKLAEYIAQLTPCLIGMEACSTAYFWARKFKSFGHTVKLINPKFVKPYVKSSNKTDSIDAEAICEAVTRPNMRFVPIKNLEQQDMQSLHRIRSGFVRSRTKVVNQARGLLAEYGIIIPKGIQRFRKSCPEILEQENELLSALMKKLLHNAYEHFQYLEKKVDECNLEIEALFKTNESCKRISKIEGIGPIVATAIVSAIGEPGSFKNGREFSAWLGLVPRQRASGCKQQLLGITKRGNTYIRTLLIHGARSFVKVAAQKTNKRARWVMNIKNKRGMNKASVALANKNARIIWALMNYEKEYDQAA